MIDALIHSLYYLIGFILGWFLHSYIHWYINHKKCCANCINFEHKGYGMGFCHKYSKGDEKHFHTDRCFAFSEKKDVKEDPKENNKEEKQEESKPIEAIYDCSRCHWRYSCESCYDTTRKCNRFTLEMLCRDCIHHKTPTCPHYPNSGTANYCNKYSYHKRTILDNENTK